MDGGSYSVRAKIAEVFRVTDSCRFSERLREWGIMKEQKQLISKIIIQDFGMPIHLKGSHYLQEAVILAIQNPSVFVMQIYQTIAEKYDKSAASIEHTMRYAIEITYDKNRLRHFFPYSFGRPSNSEVIWTVVENVKRCMLIHDTSSVTCSLSVNLP